jgi:hypothetical protein
MPNSLKKVLNAIYLYKYLLPSGLELPQVPFIPHSSCILHTIPSNPSTPQIFSLDNLEQSHPLSKVGKKDKVYFISSWDVESHETQLI